MSLKCSIHTVSHWQQFLSQLVKSDGKKYYQESHAFKFKTVFLAICHMYMSYSPHLWAFALVPTYSYWDFLAPPNAPLCSLVSKLFYCTLSPSKEATVEDCVCLSVCVFGGNGATSWPVLAGDSNFSFLCTFCTLMKLSPVFLQSPIDITIQKHPTVGTSAPHMYMTHWQTGW